MNHLRICRDCGYQERNHPFRHPFVCWQHPQPATQLSGPPTSFSFYGIKFEPSPGQNPVDANRALVLLQEHFVGHYQAMTKSRHSC